MYFHLQLIPLTIIYVAMAITGIIGNISVCWVILRIPYMRSATNYYLFSLAVSDLLILLLGNLSSSKKFPIYFIHESKSCFFLSNVLSVSICGCSYVYFNKSYFCNNTWSKVKTYGNVKHCNGANHNYLITSNLTHEDLHQLLSKLRRKQFFIMGLNYWDMVWLSPQ